MFARGHNTRTARTARIARTAVLGEKICEGTQREAQAAWFRIVFSFFSVLNFSR